MELRHISLRAEHGAYDDTFFISFFDNSNFVSNFLSRKIRNYHVATDGTYNMICVSVTTGNDSCRLESVNSLSVSIHFSIEEKNRYLKIKNETERFELYLSLLEKGYYIANTMRAIPIETLLTLHDEFRNNNYRNERLFKKKRIKEYGITVTLIHAMTSYDYQLKLFVHNSCEELIGEGCIYKTLPDELLFDKKVRNLAIREGKLIILDFLNHPQFECSLNDLSTGVINPICLDENTKKYMPNETNRDKFERLKWGTQER